MKTVKYRCKKCGYSEEYSKKEQFLLILGKLFKTTLLVFGLLLLVYFLLVGPVTAVGSITTSLMMKYANQGNTHDELRHMGIEWTKHCEPFDQLCFAYSVYQNLDHIPYVQASLISPLQPPEETYEYGGDCKNSAILYTSVMTSLGAKSLVLCSSKESHCVSVVPDEDRNVFYVVDLTMPNIFVMQMDWDAWDYDEIGESIKWGTDFYES